MQINRIPGVGSILGAWIISSLTLFGGTTVWAQQTSTVATAVVNDVTQLNPIHVDRVVTPHSIEDIVQAVKDHPGPISIGGGRFSMGGQTATEQALQLDMRQFNKVLAFSAERKEITVQTGATWRQIQEFIDPYNLSVSIMQTYADFTVGGSLSVNCHGRYIGQGPLVLSVKRIGLVLADGRQVNASPQENAELFYGAIGGYGGIGVITDATLQLADNVKVKRVSEVMPLKDYKKYFFDQIRSNPDVIFHNADLYPNDYDTVRANSYEVTDSPITQPARLIPKEQSYWREHTLIPVIADFPGGKFLRQHVIDPIFYSGQRVTWRNYEASYSVLELEPASRKDSTFVLQEYFVPVDNIEGFVERMRAIFKAHDVNVINVSIRHAKQDPGTLLAWAKQEVFAFVIYYKQDTTLEARDEVGVWTRELIDAAVANGGRYYLPYQIHATAQQFHDAYPGWDQFFALKKKVDPTNKFRNKLWDAYYLGTEAEATSEVPNSVRAYLDTLKDYRQPQAQTYLTMPEWFLVYSPDEYARYIDKNKPSGYPYFGAIGQFWGYYGEALSESKPYPFNLGYNVMVSVIGASFTLENAVKGAYENTIGRVSEWTVTEGERTPEDDFAAAMAKDYVRFIRVDPWYEYSFWSQFKNLWTETPMFGKNQTRKFERKFALSLEYLFKSAYSGVIKVATKSAYGDAEDKVIAVVRHLPRDPIFESKKIKVLKTFDGNLSVLSLPRYEEFLHASREVVNAGGQFVEIAGNKKIFLTTLKDGDIQAAHAIGQVHYSKPILTQADQSRLGMTVPVDRLGNVFSDLDKNGFVLEHVYDY
ncbi:MAG TPA: FAD-binding oxidoreductase [Aquabacterium sp.]|nr:FAD-binding oxidoreductase [Aquabacterium sp.]